jgi:hypothetical protein
VSLLPVEELRDLLPNASPHRLTIKEGQVDYMFLAHHDFESLTPSPNRMGAKLECLGNMEDLRIGTIDSAIVRQGELLVQKEVYLEEWLREEIHELFWGSAEGKRSQRIDALLGHQDRPERYGNLAALQWYLDLGRRRQKWPGLKT